MPKETNWSEEMELVLSIIESTELEKAKKWGTDVYTINGKNVVSYLGFKNHFAIWFYNGVFLKDKHKILISSSEDTKAMRKWHVQDVSEINPEWLEAYILEAIQNEKEGKIWKPQKTSTIKTPVILITAFQQNNALKTAFEKLTAYKQKEYIEHITSAKKEETNLSRLGGAVPLIMEGKGLHDKYK